jgi:site-specific recombinase XerD
MGDITLRKALRDYKSIYMAYRNFADRTRVEYQNDLEDLIQFLERIGVKEVRGTGLPQLEQYLAELDHRGIASSTRKRKVVSIRSFLSYLYDDQYTTTNLAKRLIPPFADARSPRYLTKSEYERLLNASSNNPRDYALIQLLLQTGIKLSELTRLTVQDVELPSDISPNMNDVGYLHIAGVKSKKGRVIPLNSRACISLANYFNGRNVMPGIPLFTARFSQKLSPRGVEKILRKYMLRTSIRDASVQSLRHTFAIHHINSGADLKIIKEVMGYLDSRSVSIYTDIVKNGINKEVQEHAL